MASPCVYSKDLKYFFLVQTHGHFFARNFELCEVSARDEDPIGSITFSLDPDLIPGFCSFTLNGFCKNFHA